MLVPYLIREALDSTWTGAVGDVLVTEVRGLKHGGRSMFMGLLKGMVTVGGRP